MPDFSRPEYASYRELSRSLQDLRWNQTDDRWQIGDWYTLETDEEPAEPALKYGWWIVGVTIAIEADPPPLVRLPSLADWLELLEEAGVRAMFWERVLSNGWYRLYPNPAHDEYGVIGTLPGRDGIMTAGPTREEAAARLYVAVTRSPADPAPPSAAR